MSAGKGRERCENPIYRQRCKGAPCLALQHVETQIKDNEDSGTIGKFVASVASSSKGCLKLRELQQVSATYDERTERVNISGAAPQHGESDEEFAAWLSTNGLEDTYHSPEQKNGFVRDYETPDDQIPWDNIRY